MKAILLNGSARPEGNCETLLKQLAEGLQKHGVEVETYNVARLAIQSCLGCGFCKSPASSSEKMCSQPDAMQVVYEGISQADIVALAAPVYMGDISGQMKVLMDRCYAFLDGEKEPKIDASKKVALLMPVGGAGNPKYFQRPLHSLGLIAKIAGINKTLEMCGLGLRQKEDASLNQTVKNQAYALGMQAFQAVRNLKR